MTVAGSAALALLSRDVGYVEQPPGSNRTKYGAYWGVDGVAWCAMTVAWAYKQVGFQLPDIQGAGGFWAYVPYGFSYARNNGQLVANPEPGDIVLYGNRNESDAGDHTGLFERWASVGTSIWAVEGNTSNTDADSNQTDGIYVARRWRPMSWVLGFWRPNTFQIQANAGGLPDMTDEERALLIKIHGVVGSDYPGWGRPASIADVVHVFTQRFDAIEARVNQITASNAGPGASAAEIAKAIIAELKGA